MSNENQEFKRTLTLLDATMLVSGSMIGSGIFIVSADMGRTVGSAGWLIFLWVLTGIITVFAALSYGELAGMMPKAGGQYVYIQRAWGDLTAFLYGWSLFAVIQTGLIAAVAVAFAKYLAFFFPNLGTTNILLQIGVLKISAAQVVAILSLLLLTFINSRGVKNGKIIQLVFTMAKLFALFALIILGLIVGSKTGYLSLNFQNMWDAYTFAPTTEGGMSATKLSGVSLILALGTAIIGSLFSSDAWNSVTFIAGEIKNPRRNIPLSLFLGTLLVTVIYVSANFAYLSLLPLKGLPNTMPVPTDMSLSVISRGIMFAEQDRVGTAAAFQIFGNSAAVIMSVLIIISTFGCNSGLILSGARVYYAMAKDGLFFRQAGTLNKYDVPGNALWLQCFWTALLCLSGTYGDLLDYCVFAALIFYCVTIAGVFVLRKKEPDTERPYRVPGFPVTPVIYIFLALSICVILLITKTFNAGMGLFIVGLGLPLYYLIRKQAVDKS